MELGGFSLATLGSDIATYLPTLGPRPFSPSLLSPNVCPYAVWGKARRDPPLHHHCPGARHQMQHNLWRLETFFRHQLGAVQHLLGKAMSIPFIHPPVNIPLPSEAIQMSVLKDFSCEPDFRSSRTRTSRKYVLRPPVPPFYTLLREEGSGVMRWVDEGACPWAPGEAQ